MENTQFEILKKIEKLYLEISRITGQIDLENDNSEQIIIQRENLLKEIITLKKEQNHYLLGASEEQIKALEDKIKTLILSVMSDSALLLERSKTLRASMKEEISKLSTKSIAAKSYAAYKNKNH